MNVDLMTPNVTNNVSNNNKKILPIIIVAAAILVVAGIAFTAITKLTGEASGSADPKESAIFTLQGSNNRYAIFTKEGKQVTDFIYVQVGKIVKNTLRVTNEKGEVGVVNSNGKMVIPFGKYRTIKDYAPFYEVYSDEGNYLFNYKGKMIYNFTKDSGEGHFGTDNLAIISNKTYSYTEDKKFINVLDIEGRSLLKFNDNTGDMKVYSQGNYATLFYKNTTYVIDTYRNKVVNKLPTTTAYCVNYVKNEDNNQYIMSDCDAKTKEFTYYKGSKKVYTKTDCTNLWFEGGQILCAAKSDQGRYIVDEKGNNTMEVYKNKNLAYIDKDTYIDRENRTFVTKFYVKGNLVKSVDKTYSGSVASRDLKIYRLREIDMAGQYDKYAYYDYKGEKLFDKNFKSISDFDQNGNAKVSEDGKLYYVLNAKQGKISKDYQVMAFGNSDSGLKGKFYLARNDSTEYLINTKGEEVLSSTGRIDIEENYIQVTENGKTKYYSAKLEMILEK